MPVAVHSGMEDLPGLLASDYGFKSSAPMSTSRGVSGANAAARSGTTSSSNRPRSGWNSTTSIDSLLGNHAPAFSGSRSSNNHGSTGLGSYEDILEGFRDPATKPSSLPAFDKPVYDEDMFDGLPGVKSSPAGGYEDVFTAMSSNTAPPPPSYDDLLGNLGRAGSETRVSGGKTSGEFVERDSSGLADLIPGFGRRHSETDRIRTSVPSTKSATSLDDPFVVLESTSASANSSSGLFSDPVEHINVQPGGTKFDNAPRRGEVVFDNLDSFDGFPKSVPLFASEVQRNQKDQSPPRTVRNTSPGPAEESSLKRNYQDNVPKQAPDVSNLESNDTMFDMPSNSTESLHSVSRGGNVDPCETKSSAKSDEPSEMADDMWLTVSEIPLFTQPTNAPPPSRPPPPFVIKDKGASIGLNAKTKVNDFSSSSSGQFTQTSQFSKPANDSSKASSVSQIDELENFAMAKPQAYADKHADVVSNEEEIMKNSAAATSAAAMKEAMDRAEAQFRHAREVRERDLRYAKNGEFTQQGRDEKAMADAYDTEFKEKQERLDHEKEFREREEKEKERKRLEKEREHELDRERQRAREAVERATREARERAAAKARRIAERSAVEKAAVEARERAERAAVQRAAAEARERAAAEARERVEKERAQRERVERERSERERVERTAAEARERAAAISKERAAAVSKERATAERAAVERAAAEARLRAERASVDRANAEARERAAAASRERQHKNENDLESFFGMGARANSAPRPRATTMDPGFDTVQNKGGSDGVRRTSAGSTSSIRKASSTTNIVDDLTSIFGAAPSSAEFQEVEGESEERRRARLERHQRTLERAAKALAVKNERDMQTQREQAERHRIAETLDVEIRRWATGKEGNLRALLSTLQYVLWPDCGWQPVSLTDLITAASVKKVYRKATLCIHPDKVQQKGANLQQKYIAEKVFDLLKEAWNKFNSEELF